MAIREKLLGPKHPQVIETLEDYADFLRKAGREADAAEIESRIAELAARGKECMGEPSTIVPVPVGHEGTTRFASAIMFERRVFGNPVEFPAVPVGAARFRLQVMATHQRQQMAEAAEVTSNSIDEARRRLQ